MAIRFERLLDTPPTQQRPTMTDSIIKPGTVNVMQIRHDSDCPTLKTGKGADCNCDPDMVMIPLQTDADIEKYCDSELRGKKSD